MNCRSKEASLNSNQLSRWLVRSTLSACVLRQGLVDRSSTPGEAAAAIDARHGPVGELTYS